MSEDYLPCERKVRFTTRAEAHASAVKQRNEGRPGIRAYHCPHCDLYHVGHVKPTPGNGLRADRLAPGGSQRIIGAKVYLLCPVCTLANNHERWTAELVNGTATCEVCGHTYLKAGL